MPRCSHPKEICTKAKRRPCWSSGGGAGGGFASSTSTLTLFLKKKGTASLSSWERAGVRLLHHIHLHHIRPTALMDRHAGKADKNVAGFNVAFAFEYFLHIGNCLIS